MTEAQKNAVEFIAMLANTAREDLGRNAADGSKARPTVNQINRTLDRLASIIESAKIILE